MNAIMNIFTAPVAFGMIPTEANSGRPITENQTKKSLEFGENAKKVWGEISKKEYQSLVNFLLRSWYNPFSEVKTSWGENKAVAVFLVLRGLYNLALAGLISLCVFCVVKEKFFSDKKQKELDAQSKEEAKQQEQQQPAETNSEPTEEELNQNQNVNEAAAAA